MLLCERILSVTYEYLVPSSIEFLASEEEVEEYNFAYYFGTDLV